MKFTIVEGKYADLEDIKEDFTQDYLFSSRLSNPELRKKYKLTHGEFKELTEQIKKEHGVKRRPIRAVEGKYYYKYMGRYYIRKSVNGVLTYFGMLNTEKQAQKAVEECIKAKWDEKKCRRIIKKIKERWIWNYDM